MWPPDNPPSGRPSNNSTLISPFTLMFQGFISAQSFRYISIFLSGDSLLHLLNQACKALGVGGEPMMWPGMSPCALLGKGGLDWRSHSSMSLAALLSPHRGYIIEPLRHCSCKVLFTSWVMHLWSCLSAPHQDWKFCCYSCTQLHQHPQCDASKQTQSLDWSLSSGFV